jgi:hypothetical protein
MTELIENNNKESNYTNNDKNQISFSNANKNFISYAFSQENFFNEFIDSSNNQNSKNNLCYNNLTEAINLAQINQSDSNIIMNKDQLYHTFLLFQKFLNQHLNNNKMNLKNINNISKKTNEKNENEKKIIEHNKDTNNEKDIIKNNKRSELNDNGNENENINEDQCNGKKIYKQNGDIQNLLNQEINEDEENNKETTENKNQCNIINGKDILNNGGNDNLNFLDVKDNINSIEKQNIEEKIDNEENKEEEADENEKENEILEIKESNNKDDQNALCELDDKNNQEINDNVIPPKNPYDDIPIKLNRVNFVDLVEKKLADEKNYQNIYINDNENEILHKIVSKKDNENENVKKHECNPNSEKKIKNDEI